jgi:S1-C subfamily serine protease
VRNVAERVRPAVVQITNQQTVQIDRFGEPFTVPEGTGSGVIYDNQGHILTNNHVVAGAQELLVALPDGRSFPGQIVGTDPQTDLAVVRIQGDNLPTAPLGDSRRLQVGDWVVAIGNALGLPGGPTVTAGVVSALGRTVQQPGDQSGPGPYLFDLVQTDAAINPGNSGGPLMNLAGEVIGINTMVAARSNSGDFVQGIGFAIGVSTARPIADEIVATGRVAHPYIGIEYLPLNPVIAAEVGTSQRSGALIRRVVSNSPAARAGIRNGDIVVEAEGQPIEAESALAEVLKAKKPGDQLNLVILRGNQRSNVAVTLGERPRS